MTHLVLDGVDRQATARLEGTQTHIVNGCHGNHKTVPSERKGGREQGSEGVEERESTNSRINQHTAVKMDVSP